MSSLTYLTNTIPYSLILSDVFLSCQITRVSMCVDSGMSAINTTLQLTWSAPHQTVNGAVVLLMSICVNWSLL